MLGTPIAGITRSCAATAAIARPVARVLFWGALAMALTAGIGRLVGTAV